MNLITMKCPACAAIVNIDNEKDVFVCDYCKNRLNIIKPIKSNEIIGNLNDIELKKYENYIEILNQSMLAGNYGEAYNYCNKALEINPKSGSLWENKAVCCFWLSTLKNLSSEQGIEILTYLNASKQNDPNSLTFESTSKSISENLFKCTLYLYMKLGPDKIVNNRNVYSMERKTEIVECLENFELCYRIFPKRIYLEKYIELLTSVNSGWITRGSKGQYFNSADANSIRFDAVSIRQRLIDLIKKEKPDYAPPEQPKNTSSALAIIIIFGSFILAIIIIKLLSK